MDMTSWNDVDENNFKNFTKKELYKLANKQISDDRMFTAIGVNYYKNELKKLNEENKKLRKECYYKNKDIIFFMTILGISLFSNILLLLL